VFSKELSEDFFGSSFLEIKANEQKFAGSYFKMIIFVAKSV